MNRSPLALAAASAVLALAACVPMPPTSADSPVSSPDTSKQSAPAPGDAEDGLTAAQTQARRAAVSYLDTLDFSKSGLTKQLVQFEEFQEEDVKAALATMDVDWQAEANGSAASYLDTMAFSRDGLIKQLVEFDGYTENQATKAVEKAGL